jgi:ADP-ribose pyrophosphatase
MNILYLLGEITLVLFTKKQTIASKSIYKGLIFNVRLDTVSSDEGKQFPREVIEHNGGVVIVCQPEPDKVILIKQYRYSVDEELIELPAGRLNLGEDRHLAAQRELEEETGYKANIWKDLTSMYSAPGFCDELLSFHLAQDTYFVGQNLDEDEHTDVMIVTVKEAWQMVKDKKIKDAKTAAGLAFLL